MPDSVQAPAEPGSELSASYPPERRELLGTQLGQEWDVSQLSAQLP